MRALVGDDDRAQDGGADRAAEGPQEHDGRGGRAEISDADTVLRGQDGVLDEQAQAEADDEQHGGEDPAVGVDADEGEQGHARRQDPGADDNEDFVSAQLRHQAPGTD